MDEIDLLLSAQSLAEYTSFLKRMFGCEGVVMEDLYSIFTLQALRNPHLRVRKHTKTCLVLCLFSSKMCSSSGSPSGKQLTLSSMRLPLLRACKDVLAHDAERYWLMVGMLISPRGSSQHS